MRYFFGCTFMSRSELADMGVKYPIKLEYYKTETNTEEKINETKYGIEVIKTSYIEEKTYIEKRTIPDIIKDELKVNQILDTLKKYKVTPVSAEYVIEDFIKENC